MNLLNKTIHALKYLLAVARTYKLSPFLFLFLPPADLGLLAERAHGLADALVLDGDGEVVAGAVAAALVLTRGHGQDLRR